MRHFRSSLSFDDDPQFFPLKTVLSHRPQLARDGDYFHAHARNKWTEENWVVRMRQVANNEGGGGRSGLILVVISFVGQLSKSEDRVEFVCE